MAPLRRDGFSDQDAREWITSSLGRGQGLARAVRDQVDRRSGSTLCVLPAEPARPLRFDAGGLGPLDEWSDLATFLSTLPKSPARSLLIEDEAEIRGYPWNAQLPDERVTYVGESVLHAFDLGAVYEPTQLRYALGSSSSGYPTNAFIIEGSPRSLRIGQRRSLDERGIARIVQGLTAIIVSAFDAESFVIWTRNAEGS